MFGSPGKQSPRISNLGDQPDPYLRPNALVTFELRGVPWLSSGIPWFGGGKWEERQEPE